MKKISTVIKFIPNIITILSMCLGLLSIRYSFELSFKKAIYAIILAAMCDLFDGRIARLLKYESLFGKELDSLADLINFGISPAILIYSYKLSEYSKIGWAICQLFIICQALRLARFNTNNNQLDYFTGIPSPAGGILVLMPLIIKFAFNIELYFIIVLLYTIFISMLLISTIKTPSLKTIKLNKYALLIVLLCIFIVSIPWLTIFFIALSYLCIILVNNII